MRLELAPLKKYEEHTETASFVPILIANLLQSSL